MSEKEAELPIIGKHISWEDIRPHSKSGHLRVTHFTEFAAVENGKVKAMSLTMPYGIASIECLEMNSQFSLWVSHKIDFLNLWKAHQYLSNLDEYQKLLKERIGHFKTVAGDQLPVLADILTWLQNSKRPEILVGDFASHRLKSRKYLPKSQRFISLLTGPWLPKLYVWMCPEGYLKRRVTDNFAPLSGCLYFEVLSPLAEWRPQV